MASKTRAEIIAEIASIDADLASSRVPDGATGLTRLSFAGLRKELRAQKADLLAQLAIVDGNGCTSRDY